MSGHWEPCGVPVVRVGLPHLWPCAIALASATHVKFYLHADRVDTLVQRLSRTRTEVRRLSLGRSLVHCHVGSTTPTAIAADAITDPAISTRPSFTLQAPATLSRSRGPSLKDPRMGTHHGMAPVWTEEVAAGNLSVDPSLGCSPQRACSRATFLRLNSAAAGSP
jgi:hypothetical protein